MEGSKCRHGTKNIFTLFWNWSEAIIKFSMSHLALLTYTKLYIALCSSVYPSSLFHIKFSVLKQDGSFYSERDTTRRWSPPSPVSLAGSFSLWEAWLRFHVIRWRITLFLHSSGVVRDLQMASGIAEGRELPITEQVSTADGDGGSCPHCSANESTRHRHHG